MKFFRASVAVGVDLPMYFIESTARDNIDDPAVPPPTSDVLKPIEDSDVAVELIAQALASGKNPNLVVMVHGFNNPYPAVLETYTAAALAINGDDSIRADDGLVCVGYRWPSEKMGTPWRGTWDAMPTLPTWLFYAGTALAVLPFLVFYLLPQTVALSADLLWWKSLIDHVLTMAGLTLAGLVLTAALLRAIVYFRDTYRATNYGAPDLVQIIRAIDGELGNLRGRGKRNDVELSFIGHSMGGFVVTNTIRVLSDVFARPVSALNSYGADLYPEDESNPTRNIGDAFVLKRFVLASPDIPAETLLSNRGNFLASAIARFEEAYLFCSEGDEVLRQISTLANYFVFPTKSSNNGFRLGNVEILSSGYGLIPLKPDQDFLAMLRVGNKTVRQLSDALRETAAPSQGLPKRPKPPLPAIFSYFDCTDYRDQDNAKDGPRGLLTFALDRKRNNPHARLSWYSHLHLLYAYLTKLKPNVHGGYFEGLLSQQLIYRLACLGFDGTVGAYGGAEKLWDTCRQKQIRVLVSPLLEAHRDQVAGALAPAAPIAPAAPVSDGALPPI
jgi:Alpha/beta hydrolase of unknown function (DUF900)